MIIGLVLSPLLTHFLPFGLDTRVAAVIIGTDRWRAGAELMQASDLQGWNVIAQAVALWNANQEQIQLCQTAAVKAHRAQRCEVSVAKPD